MPTLRTITLTVILAIAAAAFLLAPAASAKGGNGVRVAGTCTQSSTAKLKLSPENGSLEVELEVDQNRNGVTWKVSLTRNGALVVSTTATTQAPSGSFSLRRVIPGASGTVAAVATSPSGERCTARASI